MKFETNSSLDLFIRAVTIRWKHLTVRNFKLSSRSVVLIEISISQPPGLVPLVGPENLVTGPKMFEF